MNRMISYFANVCFTFLVMLALDVRVASADTPPHIIFVMADDQGCFASVIEMESHEKGISSVIFCDFKLMQSDPN